MTTIEEGWVGNTVTDDIELARFRNLESLLDGHSRRLLDDIVAVQPGWRCLELGSGAGSIARWLAERVGPNGKVVAVDIEPRFLVDLPDNVEVRALDAATADFATGEYDLVHHRAVLAYVPQRDEVVGRLRLALEGRFDDHHALMLRMHLDHIDHLTGAVDAIDEEVDRRLDPFAEPARRLQTIPGIGKRTAEVTIAEIGIDMSRFPTSAHLASWAGLCPGNHESAGKRRSGKARKGNAALRSALCEAAWCAAPTKDTYLSAQFRRFCRRSGKKGEGKAIFAVAHTLIRIIWHVLNDESDYIELGPDRFDKHNDAEAHARRLVHQLEKLGHRVTLEPAA